MERFLADLADGIVEAGGSSVFGPQYARETAAEVVKRLQEIGPFAYPSLLDRDGLRFVYQWDEDPPLLTIMWWDERMWRDMVRIQVPPGIVE